MNKRPACYHGFSYTLCLMTERPIRPVTGPVSGSVRVPGSKSITNRALILAALARGTTRLTGALFADDTWHLVRCLQQLGVGVETDEARNTIVVHGAAGQTLNHTADLFVGNSGTTARFLLPMLAGATGTYRVDGVARMRQRPMGSLFTALRELGAEIEAQEQPNAFPIVMTTRGVDSGHVAIAGNETSQFVSGLLLAAPTYRGAKTTIDVIGTLQSVPYVRLTLGLVEAFGGRVEPQEDLRSFSMTGGQEYVSPGDFAIEPDASAASYFFAIAAATGGTVRIPGLTPDALQGDVRFVDILAEMGCRVASSGDGIEVSGPAQLTGVSVDMNAISDTAMTLAAIAPLASTPTTIRNVAHMRHKETDRVHAVVTELRRLGVTVDEHEDGMTVYPCSSFTPAAIETYDDHRIAMAFAVLGLRVDGVRILNPDCVAKTYPRYFEDFDTLTGAARAEKGL